MYHYIKDPSNKKYFGIKGLLIKQFNNQLEYLKKHYTFVTMEDCNRAKNGEINLPFNSCLLTFDDGYMDHYKIVFPILKKNNIQGSFFPPAKVMLTHEVLDVNKIHFILASNQKKTGRIIKEIYSLLNEYRSEYHLDDNNNYYKKLAVKNRFDSAAIVFVKRLLQVELDENLRKIIIKKLFNKYVTTDTVSFSKELYMNIKQIKYMIDNGMYVGSHGFDHYWLNKLSTSKQESEIEKSIEFLEYINAPSHNWVMCYPYGAYNKSLIEIIKNKGCSLALTTKVGIATLSKENAYTLERLDTNDFPKSMQFQPALWTQKLESY